MIRGLRRLSTANSTVDLVRLVSSCIDVAGRAGTLIQQVFVSNEWENTTIDKTTLPQDIPGPGYMLDPRTVADLKSQNLIIGCLNHSFPHIKLIGEEDEEECKKFEVQREGKARDVYFTSDLGKLTRFEHMFPKRMRALPADELLIWIDPLDGTGEFIRRKFDSVTVMIGISLSGSPIAGVIHQPHTGNTVWGVVGVGSYGIHRKTPPPERRKVVTTRLHFSFNMLKVLDVIKPTEIQKCGGAGGKILRLIRGDADAYVHADIGTKKWDSCAGDAIVRAAGGMMTDMYGRDIDYTLGTSVHNRSGLAATLGVPHHEFIVHPNISFEDPKF
jgi:3'(2'), 5'-bisphosphate nucleotidase